MIAIIDYGMGNLHSVAKAFDAVGAETVVSADAAVIAGAERVVLPGVGALGDCMDNLQRRGLVPVILEALSSGKPFLGICLGLQLLFGSPAVQKTLSNLFVRNRILQHSKIFNQVQTRRATHNANF